MINTIELIDQNCIHEYIDEDGDRRVDFLKRTLVRVMDHIIESQKSAIPCVTQWVAVEDEPPQHGEKVMTYTPDSDISEEQQRLIRYGSQMNGFPHGVTHWKHLDKPPCG